MHHTLTTHIHNRANSIPIAVYTVVHYVCLAVETKTANICYETTKTHMKPAKQEITFRQSRIYHAVDILLIPFAHTVHVCAKYYTHHTTNATKRQRVVAKHNVH
mgnify:CR=1 FL=1